MSNLTAFLSMIAVSEGTKGIGDDGYNVLVGSTKAQPVLFHSYADHPRIKVQVNRDLVSTAAGRYQILARYFDAYKIQLRLQDFGHDAQDIVATQMIRECDALYEIGTGNFDEAAYKCRSRWASLPGANYGQRENRIETLRAAYVQFGGSVTS